MFEPEQFYSNIEYKLYKNERIFSQFYRVRKWFYLYNWYN